MAGHGFPLHRRGLLGLGVLALLRPATGWAEPALPAQDLKMIGKAKVVEVVDGDTVRLDNREQVRLVGTQAPKLPLDRPNFKKWPFADESKARLEALCLGRSVTLHAGGAERDRHGRVLAHLACDGVWLQGAMIEGGFARVYTFKDNRALADRMLPLEASARTDKRGLWADATYRVRRADDPTLIEAVDGIPGYLIVQGKVRKVGSAGGRWFLNFGADRTSDFTATVAPDDAEAFAGVDLAGYADRVLQVRGWLEARNGPSMDLTHPEQIEIVARD
ncbi:thermonuclease family protein [Oleomonas cavernae]|uniref:Thermonuclease family protein n=1 Tax=Oleomonas cavernae TaxID=2320859 RepID=A0A418WCV1_9PROT|nr:thermonuclease family protein [Oleomonas cavernae]RJF87867.1 thermonuclease family protein [Oleomonas cavernae]